MGFDGFTDKDFDTYLADHRGSATFTLQRRLVKDKLRALMSEVMAQVGESARGLELVFSSEVPSLENGRCVAEQGAYLIRGATDREAVKALVEKMSLRSAMALDVAEFHKHASIGVVVDDTGLRALLAFHPRGQVDRQNLKAKLGESWAVDAFLAQLQALPEGFRVLLPGMPAPVAPAELARAAVEECVRALEGDAMLLATHVRPRDGARGALAEVLTADLQALLALYRFSAWAPDHDQIHAVKQAKQQREESRKADFQPGMKVRILAGMWNGKVGVVESLDKKGGVKVMVGAVSVKIEARDAQPV
ncbi:MAG: hypothetical protein HY904_03870 [Deltaproteobacteria bacterium]|nr:hypothetical protein [Deltaproteobacteria bacterium]